jgi:DNA-binding NarL/FixJ family response regulator
MPDILIGDDHDVFRRGTRDILHERFDPVAIEEAESGLEMIRLAEQSPWDVCIMDVTMQGKSGTDLLQELIRVRPSTPILALSMHPESTYAVRMIVSGASGYLNKAQTSATQLTMAIETLLSGHKYITPQVAEYLAEGISACSAQPLHELLSKREFQVFRMLATGRPLKEIAGELFVSAATVSTYRSRVMEKLNVDNNAKLVRYAMKHSLID